MINAADEIKELTLGSLFDGSGGFPLGAVLSGIRPIWASEIEPFPIAVTKKRFPYMEHYGDINKLNGAELPPVDIITFGSPCQDLSIAGLRSGISGSRSSLFFEAVRIIKEMRCKTNGKYPKYAVWENVPGVLSSNGGEDFKAVLEELCRIKDPEAVIPQPKKWENAGYILGKGYSVAYRILNAAVWGVPQRRKRIFLVADLDGECAGKILFESEGLSGYSAKGFRAWQRAAGAVETCVGTAGTAIDGYNGAISDKTPTPGINCGMSTDRNDVIALNYQGGDKISSNFENANTLRSEGRPPMVYENHGRDIRYKETPDVSQTITANMGTGGNNQPLVVDTPKTLKIRCGGGSGGKGALIQENLSATLSTHNDQTLFQPVVYGVCSKGSNSMNSDNPYSGFYETETSRTIDTNGGNPSSNQGGMVVLCVDQGGGKSGCNITEDFSPTLACTHGGEPVVAIQSTVIGRKDENGPDGLGASENVCYTLDTTSPHAVAYKTGTIYTSSGNSHFTRYDKDVAATLAARDYKEPPYVRVPNGNDYIVRRLTPKECARLQGFPDWWCNDIGIAEPTEEDIAEWRARFIEFNEAMGKFAKPKSDNQIIKWLKNPHSDSAEYKMWGNGVALPCVFFVLAGIKYFAELPKE